MNKMNSNVQHKELNIDSSDAFNGISDSTASNVEEINCLEFSEITSVFQNWNKGQKLPNPFLPGYFKNSLNCSRTWKMNSSPIDGLQNILNLNFQSFNRCKFSDIVISSFQKVTKSEFSSDKISSEDLEEIKTNKDDEKYNLNRLMVIDNLGDMDDLSNVNDVNNQSSARFKVEYLMNRDHNSFREPRNLSEFQCDFDNLINNATMRLLSSKIKHGELKKNQTAQVPSAPNFQSTSNRSFESNFPSGSNQQFESNFPSVTNRSDRSTGLRHHDDCINSFMLDSLKYFNRTPKSTQKSARKLDDYSETSSTKRRRMD